MKQYKVTDLTGDRYLNPAWPEHSRAINTITSIAIHHNAIFRPHDYDSVQQYRNEAAAHYTRLGPGLQYTWCIDNIGERFRIRPDNVWLHAVGSAENVSTIHICLDGNFENQEPTREQLESLYQLLEELCERRPDFPATWQNVRPHADYSATACCGKNLRGLIYPIQDRASAQAHLLNRGTFDWPELQPTAPTPPPVPPTPPTVEVNYRVFKDGKQIGAYKLDTNAWNKFKAEGADKITDQNGNDVTAQLKAKFEPPTPPPAPPVPDQDHDKAQDARLSALEAIVQAIVKFLDIIFNSWRK